jgi:photosystem II stability/assembly factor-like uncharacterized protein
MAAWGQWIFAGTLAHGVFASSDRGVTWERFGTNDPRVTITSLVAHGDTLYVGTEGHGVYCVGLANPGPWQVINDGLYWSVSYTINTLYATPTHLLAGAGANGHVFRRVFGGPLWEDIMVDPPYNNSVTGYAFLAVGDALLAGTSSGIYRAPLDGSHWSKVGLKQFPGGDVNAFAVHGERIYASIPKGGEYFLAVSDDHGSNWLVTDHEFALLYGMMEYQGRLYAAREDGLYAKSLNVPQTSEPVASAGTAQITAVYPQPAAATTTVGFSVDESGPVSLTVVDMLGRVVATVSDGRVEAGMHLRAFDAGALPRGAYLLRLEAAGVRDVRLFSIAR